MNKARLHHFWRIFREVRPWCFLVLAIISGVVCIAALRHNNVTMVKLRDVVYKADEQNGDVETALRNLRAYVYAHMNTSLSSGPNAIKPPVQLKYRYDRLVEAEKQRVATANAQIYKNAQAACGRAEAANSAQNTCIQAYVANNGAREQNIPDALYKFDFISPRWSSDLAGITMVLTGVFFSIFLVGFISDKWLQRQLRD